MNKKRQIWVHFVVLLSLMLIPFGSISAQGDPFQVFFNPDPAYIYTDGSNSTVVTVDVANAVDIWSFTIIIEYNKNLAVLTGYEFVDVFGGISCPVVVNNPGKFAIACTAWGENPVPFFGNGTLLRLTFGGVALGTTPLTFTTVNFGNSDNVQVPVLADNGELKVVDTTNLLYLPLIANFGVQGKLDRSGVKLSLAPGANYGFSYDGWSTNNPGDNLLIGSVGADRYLVTASHEGCLSARGTILIPSNAVSYSLPALILRSGNAQDEDDVIDVYDLAVVNGAYGDFDLNPEGDVNFDGKIDARDLALVAGNFGLTSAAAYADWLPEG